MSQKRNTIIVGLASISIFAGFTLYTNYYDHTRNINSAAARTLAQAPAPTSDLAASLVMQDTTRNTLPVPALVMSKPDHTPTRQEEQAPQTPLVTITANPPVQPETVLPPALHSQTGEQPSTAPNTVQNDPPQITQPAAPGTPAAPAPAKKKTTTTRAS